MKCQKILTKKRKKKKRKLDSLKIFTKNWQERKQLSHVKRWNRFGELHRHFMIQIFLQSIRKMMWALKSSFFIWLSDKRLSLIKGIIDGWRSQDWQQQQTQRLSSSSDRELVRRWSPLRTLKQMGNGRLQNQTGEGLIENADTTLQKKQNLKVQWSLNQQIRLEWNRDNNAALSCTAHTLVLTSRAQIRFHFTIFFFKPSL